MWMRDGLLLLLGIILAFMVIGCLIKLICQRLTTVGPQQLTQRPEYPDFEGWEVGEPQDKIQLEIERLGQITLD